MKQVTVKIMKDKSGEFVAKYEVEGYAGLACEEIATVLSSLGNTTEKKISDSAYTNEIPVPIPVNQRG